MPIDSSALPFGKGEPRRRTKRRRDDHERAVIAAVWADVFRRDQACRYCGGARRNWLPDQMDEALEPRSATRGRPPEERFNTWNCCRACSRCHSDKTENRIRVVAENPALGCDGPLRVERVRGKAC